MKTNDEIIEENSMKLTRDWNSFKQTKLHLLYMLNEARASERAKLVERLEIEIGKRIKDDDEFSVSHETLLREIIQSLKSNPLEKGLSKE